MGKSNFSEDFKRDTVPPLSSKRSFDERGGTVRGYPVREVSEHLAVSTYLRYNWMKLYAKVAAQPSSVDHKAENRRLKSELARMTEEPGILKPFRVGARLCAVETACATVAP